MEATLLHRAESNVTDIPVAQSNDEAILSLTASEMSFVGGGLLAVAFV